MPPLVVQSQSFETCCAKDKPENITEAIRQPVYIFSAVRGPIKESTTTFSINEIDDDTTRLTMSAEIQPKGGIFAGIIAKILERRLPKRAIVVVEDLAASAEKNA